MLLSERITLLPGAVVLKARGGNLRSSQQTMSVGWKQLFHGHGPGDDPLLEGVLDYLLQRLPVGCDAGGQGFATGDLHDLPVQFVDAGRVLSLTALEALSGIALGRA